MRGLFSNTKPAENDAQQIVGAELPGDRIQLILCKPQLFGEQIERLRILLCMVRGNRQMFPRRAQRNQVPLARQIDALRACLPPGNTAMAAWCWKLYSIPQVARSQ